MTARRLAAPAGAFLVAAALGWFGAGLGSPAASTEPPGAPEARVSPRPDLSGCELDELEQAVEALEVANEALYQETRALARENEVEGVRLTWPEALSREYEEDALRARAADVLRDVPEAALIELDCAQYPCIAVLASLAEDEGRLDAAREGLVDGLGVLTHRTGGVVEEMEWFSLRYAALGEGALDQREQELLRQRMDEVAARATIDVMRETFGGEGAQ